MNVDDHGVGDAGRDEGGTGLPESTRATGPERPAAKVPTPQELEAHLGRKLTRGEKRSLRWQRRVERYEERRSGPPPPRRLHRAIVTVLMMGVMLLLLYLLAIGPGR